MHFNTNWTKLWGPKLTAQAFSLSITAQVSVREYRLRSETYLSRWESLVMFTNFANRHVELVCPFPVMSSSHQGIHSVDICLCDFVDDLDLCSCCCLLSYIVLSSLNLCGWPIPSSSCYLDDLCLRLLMHGLVWVWDSDLGWGRVYVLSVAEQACW
jgi:hypothetical protein